jgi:uncharacterized protein
VHHVIEDVAHATGALEPVTSALGSGVAGVIAGAIVLAVVSAVQRVFRKTARS